MKVSWDYYSRLNGKIKNAPNHQPVQYLFELMFHVHPFSMLLFCTQIMGFSIRTLRSNWHSEVENHNLWIGKVKQLQIAVFNGYLYVILPEGIGSDSIMNSNLLVVKSRGRVPSSFCCAVLMLKPNYCLIPMSLSFCWWDPRSSSPWKQWGGFYQHEYQ
jgi:hypothetical protein